MAHHTYYRSKYGIRYSAESEGRFATVDYRGNLIQTGNGTLRFCLDLERVRLKYVPEPLRLALRDALKMYGQSTNPNPKR